MNRTFLPLVSLSVCLAACGDLPPDASAPEDPRDTPRELRHDVTAETTARPAALAETALGGPAVVSGSAWRSDRGEFHTHVLFDRVDAPVTRLVARLLDDRGAVLDSLAPVDVDTPERGARGIAQIRLPGTPARDAAAAITLRLEDARGGRSAWFTMPVVPSRGLRDGERCIGELGLNECDLGSACGPSQVCARPAAPTLVRAEAFRTDDGRSGVRLSWDDPNGDVDGLEVNASSRCPVRQALPGQTSASVREAEFRWPTDVFGGLERVSLRLRDRGGAGSAAVVVPVSRPATLDAMSACDAQSVASRCGEGLVCTRFDVTSCGPSRCLRDVRECPAGTDVTDVVAEPTPEGTIAYTETRSAAVGVRVSPCDRDLGAERVYRVRAPTAGTWRFDIDAPDARWTSVTARTRCALGDVGASARAAQETTHATTTLALDAGEDVYVFVTASRPSGSTFALTASRAR